MSEEKIEEGEIDSYMDATHQTASREEEIVFLTARYEVTKRDYKEKMLLKAEALAKEDKRFLAELRQGFQDNYATRKYVVRRLRALGVAVVDPFIAG